MTACGRYPPQPWHKPIAFYSCARLGDPELMAKIMDTDPYFITQDNGAGAPIHFATTYKQLDMVRQVVDGMSRIEARFVASCIDSGVPAADPPLPQHGGGGQPAGR
jgi:[acyl-carrier-protein] S-malonyltransferase